MPSPVREGGLTENLLDAFGFGDFGENFGVKRPSPVRSPVQEDEYLLNTLSSAEFARLIKESRVSENLGVKQPSPPRVQEEVPALVELLQQPLIPEGDFEQVEKIIEVPRPFGGQTPARREEMRKKFAETKIYRTKAERKEARARAKVQRSPPREVLEKIEEQVAVIDEQVADLEVGILGGDNNLQEIEDLQIKKEKLLEKADAIVSEVASIPRSPYRSHIRENLDVIPSRVASAPYQSPSSGEAALRERIKERVEYFNKLTENQDKVVDDYLKNGNSLTEEEKERVNVLYNNYLNDLDDKLRTLAREARKDKPLREKYGIPDNEDAALGSMEIENMIQQFNKQFPLKTRGGSVRRSSGGGGSTSSGGRAYSSAPRRLDNPENPYAMRRLAPYIKASLERELIKRINDRAIRYGEIVKTYEDYFNDIYKPGFDNLSDEEQKARTNAFRNFESDITKEVAEVLREAKEDEDLETRLDVEETIDLTPEFEEHLRRRGYAAVIPERLEENAGIAEVLREEKESFENKERFLSYFEDLENYVDGDFIIKEVLGFPSQNEMFFYLDRTLSESKRRKTYAKLANELAAALEEREELVRIYREGAGNPFDALANGLNNAVNAVGTGLSNLLNAVIGAGGEQDFERFYRP